MSINLSELSLAIELIKGNTRALDLQDNATISEIEATEAFKELTEHTLGQIVADLQSYLNCLHEVKRQAEENGGEVPDGEPSIAAQLTNNLRQVYSQQGLNVKAVNRPSPDVDAALKNVFGGLDIFG